MRISASQIGSVAPAGARSSESAAPSRALPSKAPLEGKPSTPSNESSPSRPARVVARPLDGYGAERLRHQHARPLETPAKVEVEPQQANAPAVVEEEGQVGKREARGRLARITHRVARELRSMERSLSGSGEMADRVRAEEVRELRHEFRDSLRQALRDTRDGGGFDAAALERDVGAAFDGLVGALDGAGDARTSSGDLSVSKVRDLIAGLRPSAGEQPVDVASGEVDGDRALRHEARQRLARTLQSVRAELSEVAEELRSSDGPDSGSRADAVQALQRDFWKTIRQVFDRARKAESFDMNALLSAVEAARGRLDDSVSAATSVAEPEATGPANPQVLSYTELQTALRLGPSGSALDTVG